MSGDPTVQTLVLPSPRLARALREEAERLGFRLTWAMRAGDAAEPVWYVSRNGAAPTCIGGLREALKRFAPAGGKPASRYPDRGLGT